MVLDREERARRVGEALDGLVVQVDVRDLDGLAGGAQALGVDRIAVVLGADRDAARREILAGLVAAVVTELELRRRAAEGEAEDLVAEADAEDRASVWTSSRTIGRTPSTAAGSPGPFERKMPSGAKRERVLGRRRRRDDGDVEALLDEQSQDVAS